MEETSDEEMERVCSGGPLGRGRLLRAHKELFQTGKVSAMKAKFNKRSWGWDHHRSPENSATSNKQKNTSLEDQN